MIPPTNLESTIQKAVSTYLHKLTSKAGKASAAKGSPSWFTTQSGRKAAAARWKPSAPAAAKPPKNLVTKTSKKPRKPTT